jgi:antitoxin HicB
MFTFAYPAVFSRDEGGRSLVSFPDFPDAHTEGVDLSQAMEEAIDRLGNSIAFAMGDQPAVPKPSRAKRGQKLVPVPLWIVGKLALHWALRELGISQSELARRLKVRETVVRRMLDPKHDTRIEKIEAALEVLGKRVVMAYIDAA